MCAEDRHIVPTFIGKSSETLLVKAPGGPVRIHDVLVESEPRRTMWALHSHQIAVQIRVARMQQPAFRCLNGDACVPTRVAAQGNHEDLGRQAVEVAQRIESNPRLPTS